MRRPEGEIAFPDIINNAVVHHDTFGAGRVVMRFGQDEKSKAIVKFKEEGEKKLALRFANLRADKIEEKPEEPVSSVIPAGEKAE